MEPGDRLPSISLERADGDGAVNLRHGGRDATVIVRLPETGRQQFRPYVEHLVDAATAFRNWNGRLLVVRRGDGGSRQERSVPPPLLRDDAHATDDWAAADEAAVIVADRFGVVYHEAHGRSAVDLPGVDDILELLRFLATQCPECGVLDEPGLGEFA